MAIGEALALWRLTGVLPQRWPGPAETSPQDRRSCSPSAHEGHELAARSRRLVDEAGVGPHEPRVDLASLRRIGIFPGPARGGLLFTAHGVAAILPRRAADDALLRELAEDRVNEVEPDAVPGGQSDGGPGRARVSHKGVEDGFALEQPSPDWGLVRGRWRRVDLCPLRRHRSRGRVSRRGPRVPRPPGPLRRATNSPGFGRSVRVVEVLGSTEPRDEPWDGLHEERPETMEASGSLAEGRGLR